MEMAGYRMPCCEPQPQLTSRLVELFSMSREMLYGDNSPTWWNDGPPQPSWNTFQATLNLNTGSQLNVCTPGEKMTHTHLHVWMESHWMQLDHFIQPYTALDTLLSPIINSCWYVLNWLLSQLNLWNMKKAISFLKLPLIATYVPITQVCNVCAGRNDSYAIMYRCTGMGV